MKWSWSFRGWLLFEALINVSVGLQRMKGYFVCLVKVKSESRTLSCVWLFVTPVNCSPPGSSVHGVSQARILEWVATSFSRGSPRPRDWTQVSYIGRQILYHLSYQGSPLYALTLLYAKQKKRHRCIEQTFGPCGRRRGWDVSREQHRNMRII